MAALREVFARFGLDFDHSGAEKAKKETESLKEGIEGVVAVFAGSELVRGVTEFAEQLERTGELAEQLNVGTDELQKFQFAAEVSGSSTEEFNASLTLLQKSLGHTAEGSGEQVKALEKLGIATKNAAGGPAELNQILPEVFDNFGTLKSEAAQAEVATTLFGRSGVKLLPLLRQGKEGLAGLGEEFKEFGGPVSEATIQAGKETADSVKKLEHAWFTLKATLGASVLPQVTKLFESVGKGTAKLAEWLKGTTAADTATKVLAGTIGITLFKALTPYLGKGLKFAAIFLAVDEVIGFLQGKDGLISRALNAAFGDGTADSVRAWVNDAIGQFGQLEATGVPIFHALYEAWGDTLNDMFTGFDKFVLGVEDAWNSLATKLHLPDFLKIDTGDAQKRIADDAAVHAAYEREAYESTNPREVAKTIHGGSDEELAYGLRVGGPRLGKKAIKGAFAEPAAPVAPSVAGLADYLRHAPPPGTGAPAVPAPAAASPFFAPPTAPAPGGFAAAFTAPPTVPVGGPQAPTQVTIDARTTVNLQGDAGDPSTAGKLARQASKSAADAHRKAAQALIPRAAQ